jgi:predicted protein tyrosine phosphatase
MKIEIMPIQDLLRIPFLRNNLGTAIVFVTENPDYYDFGLTQFTLLNVPDSDIFNDNEIEQFKDILEDIEVYETIYVCCDAGISRSPAVALYIAEYFGEKEQAEEIKSKYIHLNKDLYERLRR